MKDSTSGNVNYYTFIVGDAYNAPVLGVINYSPFLGPLFVFS